jgi:hypothetical protein
MIDINPGTELYRWMLDFDYGDTNLKILDRILDKIQKLTIKFL